MEDDPIIHTHVSDLYDTLLEQNLCRLLEPFSAVEIDHIAKLIALPVRDIERKLLVNPELFLVGELDGKVIATCMAGYEGHRGWINYLAVAPQHQRKGFAREIMQHAESLLRAAGCPKINLQVRSTNAAVIAFYEQLGFQIDAVTSLGKRLVSDHRAN